MGDTAPNVNKSVSNLSIKAIYGLIIAKMSCDVQMLIHLDGVIPLKRFSAADATLERAFGIQCFTSPIIVDLGPSR